MALGLFVFALALSLWGCNKPPPTVTGATPILVVNGESIHSTDFAKALARHLKKFDALAAKDPAIVKKAKETVTRDFIVSTLLRQYAQSKELAVGSAEVDREFDRVRKTYPDDFTFKSALANEGLNMDEWRERLKKSILERKVFNLFDPPSDEQRKNLDVAARKYYEEHRPEFVSSPQVRLQQIVVAKEDDALRLMKKIRDGVPFGELAKRYSIAPEGSQGGEIGYVKRGTLPVFDATFKLRAGQMSGVVKSNYGFHIIKVLDKRDQTRQSFEQARGRIMGRLTADKQQQAFNKWLEAEIKRAKIERNDTLLETMKIHTEDARR